MRSTTAKIRLRFRDTRGRRLVEATLCAYLDAERSKGALFLTALEQSKGEFRCAFVRDREGKGREALSLAVMGLRLIAASHPENLKMIRGKQDSVA